MRLPTFSPVPRRWPLFGPAVLLLILIVVSAAIWAGTSPAGAQDSGELRVSATADPANPETNESTRLTATIANPPSEGEPAYDWEGSLEGGEWYSYGNKASLSWLTGQAETWAFRVTVSYDSGETAMSEAVTVTWSEPAPEPTPTPTPEPTPEPTQEPTPEPTPEPTQEPTQEPKPTPEPTQEPTPEPTQEPTPTPTPPPAPAVTGVAVTSNAGDDDTYILGDVIRVMLTFREAVEVTGTPQLKIDMDPADWGEKWAGYESGGGTASLTFAHTVVEPNYSTQGIAVLENSLELNGGTIQSASSDTGAALAHDGRDHDPEHKVDWRQSPITTPTVTAVEITSDAGDEDTYLLGDTIRITLTFSERVNVTGTPQLKIDMDPADWGEKWAGYHGGSGTARLTFAHTVVEPNISTQGIAVLENSLDLNGGSIKSASSDTDAELSHTGRDHDARHKVDWQRTRPNRAPVVNTGTHNYDWFIGRNNAPRGVLVSKSFYQVFTDPDGDELTYSVSIADHHRQLLNEFSIGLDHRTPENSHRPLEAFHRVWFRAEPESDWKANSPALSDPVLVTATVTATDPEGLSVSLDGDFLIWWESHPEVVRATASEQAIELTFDAAVEDDPAPTAGQFTVNVVNEDGTTGTVSVSSVSVNGAVLTLGLGSELATGQTVTLDYAHDDDTPLKRAAEGGDHAPGFTGQAVAALPGAVSNLEVIAEPGWKALLVTWDAVEGATSYKLRWRQVGGEFEAASAVTVSDPTGVITVSDYGQWEVRAQGCNDAGCGPEAAATVNVVRAASLRLERAVDSEDNVRSRTLSANWDRVEGAASYSLSWQRLGGDSQANAQAQTQAQSARQSRSVSAASLSSGQDVDVQTSNQLTFGAEETGAEFTVPDDGAYRAEFRALDDGNGLIAMASNLVNQAPGQPDTTPPRLVRGEINGDTMTFYFSEPLDEDATGCRFQVIFSWGYGNVWGNFTARPRKGEVSGNKVVVVGLSWRTGWPGWERAQPGYSVRVYYFKDDSVVPAGERLRDLAGNEVLTPHRSQDGAFPATRTIWIDNLTQPPLLERAEAHPRWLSLTFDETLDGNSVPAASAFTVTVNGSAASMAAVEPVAVSGDTVTLVLASPVSSTDAVTVSYAKPPVKPLRGTETDGAAPSFSARSVTNLVGTVPSVSQVAITSTPADGEAYAADETVQVSLTFTEAVAVTGAPRLRIKLAPAYGEKWADYSGGSGTATLTFAYTVAEPDRSTRGVAVLRDALDLNGGTIRSVATPQTDAHRWYPGRDHDGGHMVDWRRSEPGVPWVTGVAITSDPGADGVYAQDDVIQVTATFSEAVNVDTTGGTPHLKIRMAPYLWWMVQDYEARRADYPWLDLDYAERRADYASGSGTAELTFEYTVLGVNRSTQGVAVLGSGLELNGGAIRSTDATPVNARLRYEGLRHDRDHRVDGKIPPLLDVAVAGTKVSVAFGEALDGDAVPPASAFTVKRTPQGGSEEIVGLSGAPTIAGGAVALTLAEPVLATDTDVKVSYSKPTANGDRKLMDPAGNEAASFTDRAADATDTTPPRLVWGQIDGDVITLYFSEALDEDSVSTGIREGDRFRLHLDYSESWPQDGQCPDRNNYSFTAKPREVYSKGNTVVVVGLLDKEKRRASVDWTIINFYYTADAAFTQRLRDLSGNPVNTPRPHHVSTRSSTDIIRLENVTWLPLPQSAAVSGNRLTLTFNAPMDRGAVPEASAFTVKVNGSAVSLAGSNPVSVSGRDVTLTLAAAVASGDTVIR